MAGDSAVDAALDRRWCSLVSCSAALRAASALRGASLRLPQSRQRLCQGGEPDQQGQQLSGLGPLDQPGAQQTARRGPRRAATRTCRDGAAVQVADSAVVVLGRSVQRPAALVLDEAADRAEHLGGGRGGGLRRCLRRSIGRAATGLTDVLVGIAHGVLGGHPEPAPFDV
jgi:hypothetical protein